MLPAQNVKEPSGTMEVEYSSVRSAPASSAKTISLNIKLPARCLNQRTINVSPVTNWGSTLA
nr:unnamed protein product [Callosobruchus chinensis]